MKTNPNHSELIDNYLSSELTTNEQIWFEKELESNPNFAAEVLLHISINNAISELDIIDLRTKILDVQIDALNRRGIIKELFTIKWQYVVAAASLTLMVSFGLNFFSQKPQKNSAIYNEYYSSYDAAGIVRSGNDESKKLVNQALSYYESKSYSNAYSLFNKVLEKDFSNISIHFYKGISCIELNKIEEAISAFQLIIDHKNNLFVEQSEWYLAISYMKIFEIDKAKTLLTKLAEEEGTYQSQAKAILRKL